MMPHVGRFTGSRTLWDTCMIVREPWTAAAVCLSDLIIKDSSNDGQKVVLKVAQGKGICAPSGIWCVSSQTENRDTFILDHSLFNFFFSYISGPEGVSSFEQSLSLGLFFKSSLMPRHCSKSLSTLISHRSRGTSFYRFQTWLSLNASRMTCK